MSAENPRGEHKIDNEAYEIQLGIPFKPFRNAPRFCIPGESDKPFLVPEQYDHVPALRRQVYLYGITGVLDVISENPNAAWTSMLAKGSRGVEKPQGETHFESIYSGRGREKFTETPHILRVSFLARTPHDYTKLLITYAHVKLGKEEYLFLWNQGRPRVKKCMQLLEEDSEPLLIVEKNLFNLKELEKEEGGLLTDEEKDRFEKEDLGRCTFVWLPKDMARFKTIEFTFNQFDGGSGQEQPTEPVDPEREPLPVLA